MAAGTTVTTACAACASRWGTATSIVRCGVGRPMGRQDPADYLLSDFRAAERSEVALMVAEAADATEFLLANGLDATQSRFNR